MTVVWVNKAWAEPGARSDVLGTDLDIDVRLLASPSSGRALKLLFLLLVLPFVPITWRTIQPEKDKFHNLSCQAVRWSLPFRRAAVQLDPSARGRPSTETPPCPGGLGVLPSHTAACRCTSGAHTSLSLSSCPPAGLPWDGKLGKSSIINACAAQGFITLPFG